MQQDRLFGIRGLDQPRTEELALQAQALASDCSPLPPHTSPQVRWMMYWIVFALFMAVETFSDIFISWYGCRASVGRGRGCPTLELALWLTLSPCARTGSLSTMRSRWPLCYGCSHPTPKEPACFTESLSTHPCPAMRRYPRGSRDEA